MPKLAFPGGALIGCAAGFVNVPRIKGTHNAMKTGMLGAEAAFAALGAGRAHDELATYPEAFRAVVGLRGSVQGAQRQARAEVGHVAGHAARRHAHVAERSRPGRAGRRGRCATTSPTTSRCKPAAEMPKIDYPKYDGVLTFDKLSSVFMSNTNHEEDQPSHLQLRDADDSGRASISRCYDGPEQRYCPAGVYEFVAAEASGGAAKRLQINAQNCVHCKTCDIKDPLQNIHWVTPEGGGGPNYPGMRGRTSPCSRCGRRATVTSGHQEATHSHAAPRTPLESPCRCRTSRVSTRSENTHGLHSAGTFA